MVISKQEYILFIFSSWILYKWWNFLYKNGDFIEIDYRKSKSPNFRVLGQNSRSLDKRMNKIRGNLSWISHSSIFLFLIIDLINLKIELEDRQK